jgi:hypothetical protein
MSSEGDGNADAMRPAQQREKAERAKLYTESLTDSSLDEVTRQEISSLYESGANSTTIAAKITAAGEGKGIYAIRKTNKNQIAVATDMPGRSQLSPTLSAGSLSTVMTPTGGT